MLGGGGGGGGYCSEHTHGIVYIRYCFGEGDSILCTKQFVGSDSVSLWLFRGHHVRFPP